MRHKVLYFLAFAVGMVVSSLATAKYFQEKYERIARDEIDSVRDVYFHKAKKDIPKSTEKPEKAEESEAGGQYDELVHALKYKDRRETKEPRRDGPYIIAPEEFGEFEDYEQISLTYYGDKVLADENDERMDEYDIKDSVGADAVNHFGEYEADAVYVRNDALRCDYEILLDERTYSEVLESKPYLQR